jgi:hypothetical protein
MNRQGKQPVPLGAVLRRAWWALLVGVHVPALLGVGRSLLETPGWANLLTALALSLTVAVFALKLADAPFLRFRSRRACAGVFLLACCLVHYEVAVSEVGREVFEQTPAALAVGVVIEGLRRAAPAIRRLRDHLAGLSNRLVLLARCGLLLPAGARAAAPAAFATVVMPRAPPA